MIEDPRIERTKDHLLIDILVVALCAMLCGAEGFVDFAEFGNAKIEFLRSFLELPNGIPSHDTFRRVFALLDAAQFAECFRHWSESLRQTIGAEIDSRRSPCGLPPAVCLAALGCRHRRQDPATQP